MHPGASGGRSHKQRLHNLENDQAENLANNERIRNDVHELSWRTALRSELSELTCKVANMAQTLEDIQERQHNKEKLKSYEKTNENLHQSARGDQPEGERRRSDRHRGGHGGYRNRRKTG